MSSVTEFDLDATVRPRRIAALTAASAQTAKQGQFQTIDDATAILTSPGANVLRVQCKPAGLQGANDWNSPVTILVRSAVAVTKPTTGNVSQGTLLHSDANGTDCTVTVLPDPTDGQVAIDITLAAPDPACRATLKHRYFVSTTTVAVV